MGTLLRRRHDGWTREDSGTASDLHSVWGLGEDDVWAVGDRGTILRRGGEGWTARDSGTLSALRAIWGAGPDDIWAVGDYGTIQKWEGAAWRPQVSGTSESLRAIWGSDAQNVWAVGGGFHTELHGPTRARSVILKWDGARWSTQGSSSEAIYGAVWGTAANDVWVVGDSRDGMGERTSLQRWNGSSWSAWDTGLPSGSASGGIFGLDASRVWVVGAGGAIAKWDGASWVRQRSGATNDLFGVFGVAEDRIWAVGSAATILQGGRAP
jgi:trimeric autotransporter adhesin